ncbi:MAG: hypothetical protein ACVCEJ_09200 [Candidatus Izemoplasmataceae bacterium]
MKKLAILLLVFTLSLSMIGTIVKGESGVRYNTFTISNGRFVRTQTAYTPLSSQSDVYGESLDKPNDIYIDDNNMVYIVSTNEAEGTGKLLVFSLESEDVTVLGEDFLINPTGVHVGRNGHIYIADRGNNVAYQLDEEGNILETYTKPNSPLFGDDEFQPRKIISDARGNVYILNNGSRGLAQFTNDNDFLGYFGTNYIQPSLRTVLQYMFFTEEQRSNLFQLSPPEISNMAIDDRGLIHTVSLGVEGTGVKRLNISGDNLLGEVYNLEDLQDVFVGPIGNIYTVSKSGYIYEYDVEGNLLFAFGGQDESNQIKGLFNVPSAIAVDSSYNIFALDQASQELLIYIPTEFSDLVHGALSLYQDGNYEESEEPWQEVLKMNDLFDLAHKGLGNAYFSLGQYSDALEEYDIARDRDGYSDAYWEVRNQYLIDNVGVILGAFFILLLLYLINLKANFIHYLGDPLKKGLRALRENVRVIDEMLYVFTYLRNPAESSYHIKRKDRVGYLAATLLLFIYFGFYIYYIYNLGFLFNYRDLSNINLLEEVLKVFLPVLLFVVSNYLIGSIREGEGRLKDVYVTTVFSLAPLFISFPLIAILSNSLTYNESFLISFAQFIAIFVTGIYFFFMVKETHYYNVKDTIISLLISFFTMVMLLLGTFIIYILLSELFTLVRDLIMEVYYHV